MLAHRLVMDVPSFSVLTKPDSQSGTIRELDLLTARELEIARLVAKGFSNKEVGQVLDISHWTVAAHLKSTFLKFGINRRAELVYFMRDLI
jgi:DNA-binding CsgD family transcriptional regulator